MKKIIVQFEIVTDKPDWFIPASIEEEEIKEAIYGMADEYVAVTENEDIKLAVQGMSIQGN